MKHRVIMVVSMVALLLYSVAAYAADSFTGKVTVVDGAKITITADTDVPSWVKKGSFVSALGGSPKVISVNGKEIVLRASKAKAAEVKVESAVTVGQSSGDELQGC